MLRQKGTKALLTRSDDTYMYLDERTAFANKHNADLFISIHANYSSNQAAKGVETFCLGEHLFVPCELKGCINTTTKNKERQDLWAQSNYFAQLVHHKVIAAASMHQAIVNRGIKHAALQVLMGVHIPAILIEIGFITNTQEAGLLKSSSYLKSFAQAISDAIMEYVNLH